ncbi:MAG TPA: hypothetical protein PKI01_08075 [Bacteroidales bacterium]|nr:hypothetical protein [Bacteroidales bacterium]
MKKTGLLLLFIFTIFSGYSEINIGNSIEWLCADAGLIATGKLKSYTKVNSDNNLWLCTFETEHLLKGPSLSPVIFTINNTTEDSLKKYVLQQTNLLVFLKESKKQIKNKNIETPWFVLESCNSMPAFVNLGSPQQVLATAFTFSVLSDSKLILSICRSCLQKIAEYEIQGKTVFMNYLETPFQTEAFNLLYSGSKCYLAVPHFMFPESKEQLY